MTIKHKRLSEMDAQEYGSYLRSKYTELSQRLRTDDLSREEMNSLARQLARLSEQIDRHDALNG